MGFLWKFEYSCAKFTSIQRISFNISLLHENPFNKFLYNCFENFNQSSISLETIWDYGIRARSVYEQGNHTIQPSTPLFAD